MGYTYKLGEGHTYSDNEKINYNHAIIDYIFYNIRYDKSGNLINNNYEGLTLESIQAYAKEIFNVDNYIPPENEVYIKEDGLYYNSGHGRFNAAAIITGETVTEDTAVVNVQYYADPLYLVKSHNVDFYLRKIDSQTGLGWEFEKTVITSSASREPYFWVT